MKSISGNHSFRLFAILLAFVFVTVSGCGDDGDSPDGDVDITETDGDDIEDEGEVEEEAEETEPEVECAEDLEDEFCPLGEGRFCNEENPNILEEHSHLVDADCGNQTCEIVQIKECQEGCVDPFIAQAYCVEDTPDGDADPEPEEEEIVEEEDIEEDVIEDGDVDDTEGEEEGIDEELEPECVGGCPDHFHCDNGQCVSECTVPANCCADNPPCSDPSLWICTDDGRCIENPVDGDIDVEETEPEPGPCTEDSQCPDEQFCYVYDGVCYDDCVDTNDCLERNLGDTCDDQNRCVFGSGEDGDIDDNPDAIDEDTDTQVTGTVTGTIAIHADLLPPVDAVVEVFAVDGIPGLPGTTEYPGTATAATANTWTYEIPGLPDGNFYVQMELLQDATPLNAMGYVHNPIMVQPAEGPVENIDMNLGATCAGCGSVTGTVYVGETLAGTRIEVGISYLDDLSYVPVTAQMSEPDPVDGSIAYSIVGIPPRPGFPFRLYARAFDGETEVQRTLYLTSLAFGTPEPAQLEWTDMDLYLGTEAGDKGLIEGTIQLSPEHSGWTVDLMVHINGIAGAPAFSVEGLLPGSNDMVSFSLPNLEEGVYYLKAKAYDPGNTSEFIMDEYPEGPFTVIEGHDTFRVYRNIVWNLANRSLDKGILNGAYMPSEAAIDLPATLIVYEGSGSPEKGGTIYREFLLPPAVITSPEPLVPFRLGNLTPGNFSVYVRVDIQTDGNTNNDIVERFPEAVVIEAALESIPVIIAHDRENPDLSNLYIDISYAANMDSAPMYIKVYRSEPRYFNGEPDYTMPVLSRDTGLDVATIRLANLRGTYFVQAVADMGVVGDPADDVVASFLDKNLNYTLPQVETIDMYLGVPHETLGEISGTIFFSDRLMDTEFYLYALRQGSSSPRYYAALYQRNDAANTYKFTIPGLATRDYELTLWADLNGDGVLQFSETENPLEGVISVDTSSPSQRVITGINLYHGVPDPYNGNFSGQVTMPEGYLNTNVSLAVFTAAQDVSAINVQELVLIRMVGPYDTENNIQYFDAAGHLSSGEYYVYLVVDRCGNELDPATDFFYMDFANPYLINTSSPSLKNITGLDVVITEEQAQCPL